MSESRAELRRQMRQRRRALGPLEQRQAAHALCRVLGASLLFRRARRVAFYLARDGEIDPAPLLALAVRLGKQCYLPVLDGAGLHFGAYAPGQPLQPNRFGIPEPRVARGRQCPPRALDLVLAPLVAFDARGGRLGMGGGFYDRSFAFLRRGASRPLLVGLAHRFQRVEALPLEPWDVPLAAVATDAGLLRLRSGG